MAFPIQVVDTFAGQNWLITPAALAVNDPPPSDVHAQKWLLTLSGVAIVNLEGNSTSEWLHATLLLEPIVLDALHYAIGLHSIPVPAGTEGVEYTVAFQVEQLAPIASLSAIYDAQQSINAGFAVDTWRPNHWGSGIDAFAHQYVGNLYTGLQVDVAVSDTDAWLYRVGYSIALLGRIVFVTGQKILFKSDFDREKAGSAPSTNQAVGTASVDGGGVTVVGPQAPSTGNWARIDNPVGSSLAALDCVLTEAAGIGTYVFSAELLLTDASGVASISFRTAAGEAGQDFLHVDFLSDAQGNNVARIDDIGPEFGTFPRNAAFLVQVALNVQASSSTVTVALTGSASGTQEAAVQPPFEHLAPEFRVVRLWQGFGDNGGFDATNIVVSIATD
jgi:hypothetical protein